MVLLLNRLWGMGENWWPLIHRLSKFGLRTVDVWRVWTSRPSSTIYPLVCIPICPAMLVYASIEVKKVQRVFRPEGLPEQDLKATEKTWVSSRARASVLTYQFHCNRPNVEADCCEMWILRVLQYSPTPYHHNLLLMFETCFSPGRDTSSFRSSDASGSTSQAANIQEALEVGAQTLLVDEDTCATNFMIRDARMQVGCPTVGPHPWNVMSSRFLEQ
jgi:hypothetical protein